MPQTATRLEDHHASRTASSPYGLWEVLSYVMMIQSLYTSKIYTNLGRRHVGRVAGAASVVRVDE